MTEGSKVKRGYCLIVPLVPATLTYLRQYNFAWYYKKWYL